MNIDRKSLPRRWCDSLRNSIGNFFTQRRADIYVAISIAVTSTIISVIDHSARGMRRGCDRTLAREAHGIARAHVLAASRRARNLLRDKRAPHSVRGRALGKLCKLKVPRRDPRRYRSGVPRSREVVGERNSAQHAQARSRQIETVAARKTGSGSIDLSMRDGSVAYLRYTDTGLLFSPLPFDRD